jgi:RHS repeat-associated protein
LYDETGNRVYEKNNTDIKIYPNKYYEDDGSFVIKYIYAGNLLIASIEKDLTNLIDVYHYNNSDQVYSSTIVSDDTGNIEQTLDYYPYGNIRINNKLNNFSEHKQYGGHYKDDTGLSYMGARYYNSNYGRFISEDPIFWTLPKEYLLDPQQMNSYAYARNNPIIYTDPDGKTAVDSINNFISNTLSSLFKNNQASQAQEHSSQNNVATVLNKSAWQSQMPDRPTGCFDVCSEMVGYRPSRQNGIVVAQMNNSNEIVPNSNAKLGVETIDKYLSNDQPITVGVYRSNKNKTTNLSENTQHYVVISGSGTDNKGKYYNFFDPGTQFIEKGTSSQNKFYLNTSDNSLSGKSDYYGKNYYVTEVRPK